MLIGFLLGLLGGVSRVYFFTPAELPNSAKLFLIAQIAVAFTALGLFISNYLELRQRVFEKARLNQENQN